MQRVGLDAETAIAARRDFQFLVAMAERLQAFARHAGIKSDDVVDERYLHRMTTVSAIATASSGGLAGRPPVAIPDRAGVFVVGDWVGPTGHLADAVMASARAAADAAIAHVSTSTRVR